ncbi:MAG TPA: PEGA domain-containing protein [Vicinamibacterales bacterium]|jgi:hypothetical protein|nr:PEGA domain-containing protein [Vicinamibacterales bacterium]
MRKHTFVATAVLAALVTAAPLASAQGRHRGNDGDGGRQRRPSSADSGRSQGGDRQSGGDRQRAERQAQPRDDGRAEQRSPRGRADRVERQRDNAQGSDNGRREVTPQERRDPQPLAQRNDGDRRGDGDRRVDGRNDGRASRYDGRDGRYDGRNGVNRYATPRTGPVPRYRDGDRRAYVQPRRNYYVYGYPSYRYYGGTRYYGYRYYDPYFAGDFFWSNHSWRARSYYVGSSWDYDLGKLRLDIDQRDAEVYIDGYYAGVIDDFDGRLQGLRLEPGNYQVEVALPGFEPLEFDVHITPGRTTTYRGSLLPE